jgi:ArsR family transcriptional regulator, virulence genes transcriptional regulator
LDRLPVSAVIKIYYNIHIFECYNIFNEDNMKTKYDMELYKLKAELCKTFAEPKRLIIIQELRDGEKSVSELREALDITQSVVSRDLGILRDKGVVQTRREGTTIYYRLTNPKICEACDIVHEILINQMNSNREQAKRLIGR